MKYHFIYSVRYYPRFNETAVVLETYYQWIWGILHILSVPVACSCPARKALAPYSVNRGLPPSTAFLHIILQSARFSGKSYWTQILCFDFPYNFFLKQFSL